MNTNGGGVPQIIAPPKLELSPIVPVMTSNSSPAPFKVTGSYSGTTSGTTNLNDAYKVFDRQGVIASTMYTMYAQTSKITLDMGSAKSVSHIKLEYSFTGSSCVCTVRAVDLNKVVAQQSSSEPYRALVIDQDCDEAVSRYWEVTVVITGSSPKSRWSDMQFYTYE